MHLEIIMNNFHHKLEGAISRNLVIILTQDNPCSSNNSISKTCLSRIKEEELFHKVDQGKLLL